ncbi:SpoIIE family protein phosphatase [Streptomyces sp. NPDC000349]|uniref:SpoIIE family protein phosphatase n=1 Tax=unclassified Streptomyces TaxID=2593676 RepID=UPI0027802B62|nr:SpoIIE family protein phosphatase [Streptomyces sp. DSM 40167]MDQ0408123.1 serine phosphatase RsbU (regulator of sigma subunit)/PAS domain-containing protein [Streptomyces sp. DSM 40167]
MSAGAEEADRTPGRLTALLIDACARAIDAAGGRAGGVYLPSGTPGLLRLAVLAGLPGRLFRPWWRLHADSPFPVADAYRLGVRVVLPNAAETMRRYPQFAAGLPFPFGSLYVPVAGARRTYGVLTVLRPAASDAAEVLEGADRMAGLAQDLGAALERLDEDSDAPPVLWEGEPLCVRPPPAGRHPQHAGSFAWDPVTGAVTLDEPLCLLLGMPAGAAGPTTALGSLTAVLAPDDGHRLAAALRETAAGRPPRLPLYVRAADGALRLVELWRPQAARADGVTVRGAVRDPFAGTVADAAADLLPEGVFCVDRLGTVVYANPRAARLLGRPRAGLLGRSLWEAVPWLDQAAYEDHLRGALLSPDPVRFHVRRPPDGSRRSAPQPFEGDWLAVSVYPGPDLLTGTLRPANRVADASAGLIPGHGVPEAEPEAGDPAPPIASTAPEYRPIVLAVALTEAVTARQVSAVVVRELLSAFGGRRLAIYLLQDRHLHLAWETGFPPGFLAPFEGVALDARLPGVETLTSGRPLFFDSMQDLAAAYPGIPLDATEGARAFLPLIASGRPVGSCILGFDRARGFSTEERSVLTALAGLIAHAMEKARRYESETALARGLQGVLLPRRLPSHPLLETAGRYLPGTQGMEVGGDWYDVVASGDGMALVIGDVQGHGVQAAATMGQLRSAVRAFALGDRPPDEVMSGVNHLLADLDPGLFASCCYIRLDPATGRALASRAGHPPPLLRHPDGRTEALDLPGGVVLGVDPGAPYPLTEFRVEPGAVLALYTDGLVERPGSDIDDGITALRLALARTGAPAARPGRRALAGVADRLIVSSRHATDRADDIALLLATRRPRPGSPR